MMHRNKLIAAGLLLAGVLVVLVVAAPQDRAARAEVADGQVVVYKTATCGCCSKWVDHMRDAGFEVRAENVRDMTEVKRREGVPLDLASCHTTLIGDYVFEGHIPPRVIKDFLAEEPELAGLAVPGMPIGSPGMEGPNPVAYDVIAFDAEGNRGVFERISP